MIISHKHQFIFLHCRKVAGSTITTLCNRHLGPKDLQIGGWPDTIEAGGKYNRRAIEIALRNPVDLFTTSTKKSIKSARLHFDPWTVNRLVKTYSKDKAGLPGGAHPRASSVRAFDEIAWKNYFKFCFVRNPWDHAVSDYHWRSHIRGCSHVSFKEFLRRLSDPERSDPERMRPPLRSNWDIYAIDGRVEADFVGRFESLDSDLSHVSQFLGLDLDLRSVPRAKGGIRKAEKSIGEFYDEEGIDLVGRIYAEEVSEFAYEPNW